MEELIRRLSAAILRTRNPNRHGELISARGHLRIALSYVRAARRSRPDKSRKRRSRWNDS